MLGHHSANSNNRPGEYTDNTSEQDHLRYSFCYPEEARRYYQADQREDKDGLPPEIIGSATPEYHHNSLR
jgi:hypothetical protein